MVSTIAAITASIIIDAIFRYFLLLKKFIFLLLLFHVYQNLPLPGKFPGAYKGSNRFLYCFQESAAFNSDNFSILPPLFQPFH